MKPEALIAAAFVAIGVASCIARYDAEASLEHPLPMSPAQDARARQMTEAVEAAAKIPQPKQDCVWISERVCVSPWLLEKRK